MIARSKLACLVVLALSVEGAFAIGRIGNNDDVPGHLGEIADASERFVAAVPGEFPTVSLPPDGSAVLVSNESIQTGPPPDSGGSDMPPPPTDEVLTMDVVLFAKAFPQNLNADESAMTKVLETQSTPFAVTQVGKSSCTFFLFGENDYEYIGVGKWGTHGYVLTAPKSASEIGKKGILAILKSTKVKNPCSP